MRRVCLVVCLSAAVAMLTGCATRGLHVVPASRDYQQLEHTRISDAAPLVDKAHRVGAQHYSPYEYFSSKHYLKLAKEESKEFDHKGMHDYATLSRDMAEAALRQGSGIPDAGELPMANDEAEARAVYEQLKARYDELDRQKAIEVSPVIYAHLTASLSHAEHELNECRQYPQAIRALRNVGPDIDTIWSQDVDDDGIVDMKDGAPWAPEDKDGFEDEDGVPDPDNDQDGILDLDDVMMMDPEVHNRWHDYDGAPDAYPTLEVIHFSSGSAALSSDAKGYLRGLCIIMAEWPDLKIHVKGHADDRSSENYNMKLSQRRAEAIQSYMLKQGCNPAQIVVSFYGESQLIDRDRAASRRVELIFE